MLADMNNGSVSDYGGLLNPPSAPFAKGGSMRNSRDNLSINSGSNLSLSVNYLPSKFTPGLSSPSGGDGLRSRKGGKNASMPKRGGGLEAFRAGESRLPQGGRKLRWNKFKWILFSAITALTLYSFAALIVCLLTWFDVWEHADIIRVGNRPELILSTLAASIGLLTSVIGWAGLLLNNRGFLAWYTFLTWITFAFLLIPGYITYKKRAFNLEGKINAQWSQALGSAGRLRVQDQLDCCGYFSPFIEATITQSCYARSVLPGCKLPYMKFERKILKTWYTAVFALVPAQIAVMVSGLLCSNHITYRFGKGMMPEAYRLNMSTMAVIMENYANQLADQYGADIAQDILARAKLNTGQDSVPGSPSLVPSRPAGGNGMTHVPMAPFHAKYDSIANQRD
jgi:hypothetical protein